MPPTPCSIMALSATKVGEVELAEQQRGENKSVPGSASLPTVTPSAAQTTCLLQGNCSGVNFSEMCPLHQLLSALYRRLRAGLEMAAAQGKSRLDQKHASTSSPSPSRTSTMGHPPTGCISHQHPCWIHCPHTAPVLCHWPAAAICWPGGNHRSQNNVSKG